MDTIKKLAQKYDLITVLGATAGGKTSFAAQLAYITEREIIGADSRQVYRRMDIGTGKDYEDYTVQGKKIPIHLIDIAEPGYKYNVFEYQKDFIRVFNKLKNEGKNVIMCGGSGMYLEAVLNAYKLIKVAENKDLRKQLSNKKLDELCQILQSYGEIHNITDTSDTMRATRAIEIAEHYKLNPGSKTGLEKLKNLVLGVKFDRDSRRKRITERLKSRLQGGMIDEVKNLLDSGVDKDILIYYGLEYKFITKYLLDELSYDEMFKNLETAIHQFSKRQMTWFRRMEKNNTKIYWLDGFMSMDEKLSRVEDIMVKNDAFSKK